MNFIKKITAILILITVLFFSSCLKENPPFLSEADAYAGISNAEATLNAAYASLATYDYFGFRFLYLTYGNSGFYVSGKGNSNTAVDNLNLCSLKPQQSAPYNENVWASIYTSINRANAFIINVPEVTDTTNADMDLWNDLIGEAYFLRAFNYFNLVRLWGEVPLRLEETTAENINMPKSSTDIIYAQIISDANKAKQLMFKKGNERPGFPASEAANMLLAKVYMQMATTDDPVPQTGENYWQKAYDEAKEVYGKYSLINDYNTLWEETEGNNTEESIFEVQFNDIANSSFIRLFTAARATLGKTWGRLRMNAELYDSHNLTYPADSIRLKATYKTGYIKYKPDGTTVYIKCYPEKTTRNKFSNAFNYLYKYWEKNPNNTTTYNLQNFKIYRYADLLLMLAEISNELQNGEQLGYVQEVLDRVGQTPQAEYNNGQEAFRKAIMYEYRYELLGEAHDWFNNRRRGYEWFKNEVIIPHNTYVNFNSDVDVTLDDNPSTVMHLPIPASEINTNSEIDG